MQASAISSCHLVSAIRLAPSKDRQEELWHELFSDPSEWWDNRRDKRGPRHPDFRNKRSREPLWLNSQHKPPWVDAHIAALDAARNTQQHHPQEGHGSLFQQLSDEIRVLCNHGHLDMAMDVLACIDQLGSVPSPTIYMSLLKACIKSKSPSHAKHVRSHLAQHQMQLTGLLGDYLAMTLAKCGCLDDAREIFDNLPCRTVFSWTAMISAYTECGRPQEALEMHRYMQEDGVEPDHYTFVSLLKACASMPDLEEGRKLHKAAREKGFYSDAFVRTTLVSMYSKCGAIVDAENILAGWHECNIESVNAILSAYVEKGQGEKALLLFRQLQDEGISTDKLTFAVVLQACSILAEKEEPMIVEERSVRSMALEMGQALHADAHRKGFAANVLLSTTLVSMYGKCGTIVEAENVFGGLSKHDVVSWSAMLSAYVEQGLGEKALQVYRQMQEEGTSPDRQTFAIAFQACGTLTEAEDDIVVERRSMALEIGQALHVDAQRKGVASDVFVGNAIVSMYGKCGNVAGAESVFGELSHRDTVSWNVMLSVYVEQGIGEKALQLYCQMQEECVVLDEVTLLCALQACSGTGSMEICRQIHFTIVFAGYDLSRLLASTLIHAYGTCASMVDAQAVFNKLPERDLVSWNACIAGYSREGSFAASFQMFEKMQEAGVKPDGTTFSSLLSACAHSGLANKGVEYFESMSRDHGITPGLRHYVSIIDLLARAGDFRRVEIILCTMPMQADLDIWLCLLGACRTHGNVELGKWAFDHAVQLYPKDSGAYILMSNIYADVGLQEYANKVDHILWKETCGGEISLPPASSE